MAANKRPVPKKDSPAEKKRKAMNAKKQGEKKKRIIDKKKVTNKEGAAMVRKQKRAIAIKKEKDKLRKSEKGKPYGQRTSKRHA
jgi:hypothetical protein